MRFATVDLVKAGWLIKDKGRWMVTEEGRNAYRDYKDPEQFYRTAQQLYRKWRKSHLDHPGKVDVPTDEKKAVVTFEEAEEQAWAEIEDYLRSIPPYDFQKIVAAILKAMG